MMGSVAAGKIADLICLEGNPLQDIGNTRRIAGVFAQGAITRAKIWMA